MLSPSSAMAGSHSRELEGRAEGDVKPCMHRGGVSPRAGWWAWRGLTKGKETEPGSSGIRVGMQPTGHSGHDRKLGMPSRSHPHVCSAWLLRVLGEGCGRDQ